MLGYRIDGMLGVLRLRLSFACWDYDRILPLTDGRVSVEGVDLVYLRLWVQEIFFRMIKHQEFDVSEMSLASYVSSLASGRSPFIAIPVFPSRMFRHGCIFINRKSGIKQPKDLIGKKVGVPEYRQTASVWIRGILSEKYGVPVSSVKYLHGPLEDMAKVDRRYFYDLSSTEIKPHKPEISLEPIEKGRTLSGMLENGEIDALYSAIAPSSYFRRSSVVGRLFPDFGVVERQYFGESGVFPIMHTIVLKRSVYEGDRWLAMTLYRAFQRAKEVAFEEMLQGSEAWYGAGHSKSMIPWFASVIEEAIQLMGFNYWPYGLRDNLKTLSTFTSYLHDQGLTERLLDPKEIFTPETAET